MEGERTGEREKNREKRGSLRAASVIQRRSAYSSFGCEMDIREVVDVGPLPQEVVSVPQEDHGGQFRAGQAGCWLSEAS